MSDECEVPVLDFKRGDDLKLDFTVQDTNTTEAIAAFAVLTTAQAALVEAQEADPVVPADVTAAEAAVTAAQAAYDAEILTSIAGWTIRAQVRRGGKLIDDLDILIIDEAAGCFAIQKDDLLTANWPVAQLECDIEFITTSGKNSSETFIINVKRDVTRT